MEGCSNSERDSSDERDIRKFSCHFFLEVFPPDSSSPWSDPKPSVATLAGNVAYVLGVKAVERLLTSVQFFASAPPYRKAVVFVNTNRRLH